MKRLVAAVVAAGIALLALWLLVLRVPADGAVLLEPADDRPAQALGPGWHLRPFGRTAVVYESLEAFVHGDAPLPGEGAPALRYTADVALEPDHLPALHETIRGDFEKYAKERTAAILSSIGAAASLDVLFSDGFAGAAATAARSALEREGFRRAQVNVEPLAVDALLTAVRGLAPVRAASGLRAPVTRALESDPKDWRLHAALGMINESEALIGEAEASYLDALALDPGALPPMERLLTVYSLVGEWSKLQRVLDASLAVNPDSVPHLNWTGLVLLKRKDFVGAERILGRALELSPDNATILANMGTLFMNTGRAEEAIAAFRRAVDLAPGDAKALVNLGTALAASDRFAEALDPLERAEASGALSHNLASTLAIVHERLGHSEKASAYRAKADALKQQEREVPAASPPA